MYKSVIIGAGPSGLNAAVNLARSGLKPLVIKGFEPSNHLVSTLEVEYFPGFPHEMKATDLLDNMFKQAENFGAEFRFGRVSSVDLSKRPFVLTVDGQEQVIAETIIIATGAKAEHLGIPGENEYLGRGIGTCAPCNGFSFRNKHVIVIGGGDAAMEEVEYLSQYTSNVTVVHRSDKFRASKHLLNRVREKNLKWMLNRTPLEVLGDDRGVSGLKVINHKSGKEEVIPAGGIYVAIGKKPNSQFLDGQLPMDSLGYLLVKPGMTETEIPGVFACGDVQDRVYSNLITAVGSGYMAASDCERFLDSIEENWRM